VLIDEVLAWIILASPAIIMISLIIAIPRTFRNETKKVKLEIKDARFKVEKDPLLNKYRVTVDFTASSPKDSVFIRNLLVKVGKKQLCSGYVGEYLNTGETRRIHFTELFDTPPPINGDTIEAIVVAYNATLLEDRSLLKRSISVAFNFIAKREASSLLPVDTVADTENWQDATMCQPHIFLDDD